MTLINRIPTDSGVLLLSVQEFTEQEKVLHNGKSEADFSHVDRIGIYIIY